MFWEEEVGAGVWDAKSFKPVGWLKLLSMLGFNEAVVIAEENLYRSQSVSTVFIHSRTTLQETGFNPPAIWPTSCSPNQPKLSNYHISLFAPPDSTFSCCHCWSSKAHLPASVKFFALFTPAVDLAKRLLNSLEAVDPECWTWRTWIFQMRLHVEQRRNHRCQYSRTQPPHDERLIRQPPCPHNPYPHSHRHFHFQSHLNPTSTSTPASIPPSPKPNLT